MNAIVLLMGKFNEVTHVYGKAGNQCHQQVAWNYQYTFPINLNPEYLVLHFIPNVDLRVTYGLQFFERERERKVWECEGVGECVLVRYRSFQKLNKLIFPSLHSFFGDIFEILSTWTKIQIQEPPFSFTWN